RGIATGIHYPVPCHRQPAVEYLAPPALPVTERLVREILTLPVSAGHTEAEADEVAAAIREFFGGEGHAAPGTPALSQGGLLHRSGHPAPRAGVGASRARSSRGGGDAAQPPVGGEVRGGRNSPRRIVHAPRGGPSRHPRPRPAPARPRDPDRPLPQGQGAYPRAAGGASGAHPGARAQPWSELLSRPLEPARLYHAA